MKRNDKPALWYSTPSTYATTVCDTREERRRENWFSRRTDLRVKEDRSSQTLFLMIINSNGSTFLFDSFYYLEKTCLTLLNFTTTIDTVFHRACVMQFHTTCEIVLVVNPCSGSDQRRNSVKDYRPLRNALTHSG